MNEGVQVQDKTIAVDLAKNVFEIGVSDRPGHVEENLSFKSCEVSSVRTVRM